VHIAYLCKDEAVSVGDDMEIRIAAIPGDIRGDFHGSHAHGREQAGIRAASGGQKFSDVTFFP